MTSAKQRLDPLVAGMLVLSLGACGGDRPTIDTTAAEMAEARPQQTADVAADVEPPGAGATAARTEDGVVGARVRSVLTTQSGLKTLSVDVAGGAVTLYGTASTPLQRERAGQLALGVDGVKSVTNHLIILKET